jgi:hypothetical protein
LLNQAIQYVEQLCRQNLIPEAAASELLEKLDGYVDNVSLCDKMELEHNDRLNQSTKILRLRQLPRNIVTEFNIVAAIEEMTKLNLSPPTTRSSPDLSTNGTHLAANQTVIERAPGAKSIVTRTPLNTILSPFSPIGIKDSEDEIETRNLSTIASSLNIEGEIQLSSLAIPSGIEELGDAPNDNSWDGSGSDDDLEEFGDTPNDNGRDESGSIFLPRSVLKDDDQPVGF